MKGFGNYEIYPVYEKIEKISDRFAFYFTHDKKPNDVQKIAEKIDKQKRNLVYLEIHDQL